MAEIYRIIHKSCRSLWRLLTESFGRRNRGGKKKIAFCLAVVRFGNHYIVAKSIREARTVLFVWTTEPGERQRRRSETASCQQADPIHHILHSPCRRHTSCASFFLSLSLNVHFLTAEIQIRLVDSIEPAGVYLAFSNRSFSSFFIYHWVFSFSLFDAIGRSFSYYSVLFFFYCFLLFVYWASCSDQTNIKWENKRPREPKFDWIPFEKENQQPGGYETDPSTQSPVCVQLDWIVF